MEVAYGVENWQRCDNCVDEVQTSKTTGPVCYREEGHQGSPEDASRLVRSAPQFGKVTYAGMMQQIIQNHRCDCLRIPNPTRSVKKMLTTPDGIFINAACFGLYPRFRIKVAEYVVTTPLDTESFTKLAAAYMFLFQKLGLPGALRGPSSTTAGPKAPLRSALVGTCGSEYPSC